MDDLYDDLQRVFRTVFDDDGLVLHDAMTAQDVDGWDSMRHIHLIIAIEHLFKIKFANAEISGLNGDDQNIGTLRSLIARKLGRGENINK
jgi:acyl carrier protein